MTRLLILFGLFAAGSTALAQSSDRYKEALAEIRLTATELCQTVPIEGTSDSFELNGQANAELSNLLRKLAQVGISGLGEYEQETYSGVMRSELATSIASSNNCKLNVFDKLVDILLDQTKIDKTQKTHETTAKAKVTDPLNDTSNSITDRIQGHWYSITYRYAFVIEGDIGIATKSNAPNVYEVGDPVFRITGLDGETLIGEQIFTDGNWRDIRVKFPTENLIDLEGGGFQWRMCRPNWVNDEIGSPPCIR